MKLIFADEGWDDFEYWIDHDKVILKKVRRLIRECRRTPYSGTGKPEPLKENLTGFWSRRITGEHRLVYRVVGDGDAQTLEIAQCRGHY